MRSGWLLLLPLLLLGCRDAPAPPRPAPAVETDRLDIPETAPRVVFLGDSITAGLHLAEGEAFPAVVQRGLYDQGLKFQLVNAGTSGDTSAGGLRRLDWLLRQKPAVVVVELGGNDGLRGQPVETIEANLTAILDRVAAAGSKCLLLGMRIPTSYGADYTEAFAALYDRLATEKKVAYVPFFMQDVAGRPQLFLADQLHPNAEGHRKLAARVAPALVELLR